MIATTEVVTLRMLERSDEQRMARLFFRLSPETIYRRFMTHYSNPAALRALLDVDGERRAAVVAVDSEGEIVGVARYARLTGDPSTAEIAVLVQDDSQGRGIGPRLLTALKLAAGATGVRRFTGTMLSDNAACVKLVSRAFPAVVLRTTNGETTLHTEL